MKKALALAAAVLFSSPAFGQSVESIAGSNPRHFANFVNAIYICLATEGHLSEEVAYERAWQFQRKYLTSAQVSNLVDKQLVNHYIDQSGGCPGLVRRAMTTDTI